MTWMKDELEALKGADAERGLRTSAAVAGYPGYTMRGGRRLLNLCSGDYLALSQHPSIVEAMRNTLQAEGAGASASRLETGNRPVYGELERTLAEWQGSEAALVMPSGYMANVGVIRALVGRGDVVFSDRMNHASIVDGIMMSRADYARYRHNDTEHLRGLLDKYRDRPRKLIATDSVFSMDGDHARLAELAALKRDYGAMLLVNEAHGAGVFGRRGEGLCHALGLEREVDVHIGTFSQAFGVYGAYVIGSGELIRYLIQTVRPLAYSAGLPSSIVAGNMKSLELVQSEHGRRKWLSAVSTKFRSLLSGAGFPIVDGASPIVSVVVGDNRTALRFGEALEAEGIAAVAIHSPSIPEGTARIRFSLSAAHTERELTDAAARTSQIGQALGMPVSIK